jgi:hypothetical protein
MHAKDGRHLRDQRDSVRDEDGSQLVLKQFVPHTLILVAQLAQWPPNLELPEQLNVLPEANCLQALAHVELWRQRR